MTSPDILLLSEVFPPTVGGSGELLLNVYRRTSGLSTTVWTNRISATRLDFVVQELEVQRNGLSAPYWGLLRRPGFSFHLRRALELRRLSRRNRRLVVHCARALPEGVAAFLARRLGGAPYICWAHGEDIAAARMSREFRMLMERVYRNAATVIANSRNTASMLKADGVPGERIEVVYPGVDTGRFRPDVPGAADRKARHAPGGECLILTVGRMQRRKGHDLALQAVAGLRASGLPVRYVIVGDGEERARLEALAGELKVTDITDFVGTVEVEDLPAYFAAADIFCHPNRIDGHDIEGFGIVFLEAASAGVVTVGGNSGGVPEAVEAGVTGLLVSGERADELEQVLRSLVLDPDRRRAMGAAGRERAVREFSWDRAARLVEAVHRRAVGHRQGSDS